MIDQVLIVLCVAAETAQQMFYRAAGLRPRRRWAFISLGVSSYVFEQTCWYLLLRRQELGVVLPLMGASYATIAMGSAWLFKEKITLPQWAGIGCIMAGVILISRYIAL